MLRVIIRSYRDAFSGLPRQVWVLAACLFVNRLGMMVLPFLELYLTGELGFGVEAAGRLDEFRTLFGDERHDYGQALEQHYQQGPRTDWQASYVSGYASSHPWEDWAESWAHYLHMVDAVDTAEAVGMEPRASGLSLGSIWPFKTYDIYREESFQTLIDRWIPLTLSLNSLSRSMGHADYYPFVISAPAYEKLAFVHRLIREPIAMGPRQASALSPSKVLSRAKRVQQV